MTVIAAATAPTFEAGPTTVIGLAAPSRGSTEVSAWRLSMAPGGASPEHTLTHEEVFVALSGRAVATLDGVTHEVAEGDALVVAPDVAFTLATAGDEPFEAVACMRCGGEALLGGERLPPPWSQ